MSTLSSSLVIGLLSAQVSVWPARKLSPTSLATLLRVSWNLGGGGASKKAFAIVEASPFFCVPWTWRMDSVC